MTEKTTIPITNKAALEIKRTCGKESYNNTTDLCCGNNLFRGGKDKNMSCCSGEAARQSCTNGIEVTLCKHHPVFSFLFVVSIMFLFYHKTNSQARCYVHEKN